MKTNILTEAEAQALEGLGPLPAKLKHLHNRYNAINKLINDLEAEKDLIKTVVAAELDKDGLKMYIEDDNNAFGYIPSTQTSVDRKKLETEFPEVAAVVINHKKITRFYSRP